MVFKSLGKWCTVAVVVALFLVWGSQAQQQSAWQTQVLAEGPDESEKRVLTPDIAVADDTIYVSYVDQATQTVWLLISTEGGVPGTWQRVEVTAPRVPVVQTRLAASSKIVCVAWQQLGDAGPEVWGRCARVDRFAWLGSPTPISKKGIPAGQFPVFLGHFTNSAVISGSFDAASANDGVIYAVWAEGYQTLKVARSADGVQWEPCGNLPDQPRNSLRWPIVYADSDHHIWVATGQDVGTQRNQRNIQVWFSPDQCVTWKGPVNTSLSPNGPDYPSLVQLMNKIYMVYDEISASLDRIDTHLSTCDVTPDGSANCMGTRLICRNTGSPRIVTDGRDLYLAVQQVKRSRSGIWAMGLIVYCISEDNGATWREDIIPGSMGNALFVDDEIFGTTYSWHSISSGSSGKVYIIFAALQEGQSRIMLSTRNTLPTGTPSAVCAP